MVSPAELIPQLEATRAQGRPVSHNLPELHPMDAMI